MTRITSFIITPFIIFAAFTFAHAQTAAELQAQLAALLQQLAALQAQLPSTSGGGSTTPSPTVVSGGAGQCPNLNRALRPGMSGSDVSALQAFLAADPSVYPEGTVSGYYGALTQAAVQRFQARRGIVSSGSPDTTGYGAVGPATRAAIASVCGQSSGAPITPGPITPGVPGSGCSIGGLTLASGATVQLYAVSQAPAGATCASFAQTRQCVNGVMSGSPSYQYASCSTPVALSSCTVGDNVIPHGTTRTFYSQSTAAFGSSCSSYSQQRTCANGTMSGSSSYRYSSCSIREANACAVGDTVVSHNTSRTFYKKSLVAYGESCSVSANSVTRTCTNGTMSGDSSFDKPSCTSATSSSCTLDGFTIANNATKDFYSTRTAPYTTGTTCPAQYKLTRKCMNGIFDGDDNFKYATCAIAAGSSCTTEDGSTIAHGEVRGLYKQASVSFGGNCGTKVNRTCTNGVLSGTGATLENKYNACTIGTGASCTTTDGVSVPHGSTTPMYSSASVAFGSTCAKVNRTCTNSSFGTSNSAYTYYRCSVGNAPTPSCTLRPEKSAYKPNEQVTLIWTTQNAVSGTLLSNGVPLGSVITGTTLASGSRVNATSYGAIGDKTVTMSLAGNQSASGQCSAIVKVQDILPPTCTLTIQKGTATPGSTVTVNYGEPVTLRWTSSTATDYATSSPNIPLSATTSLNVATGNRTFVPRESSYTYHFNNAGGSTSCTVNVNYNAPTCTLATVPATTATTKFKYGDLVTLAWTSTNADSATLTATGSSTPSQRATSTSASFTVMSDTTFSFNFAGLGGTKACSRLIDIDTPITMNGPNDDSYQPANEVQVSWSYLAPPTAPAGTKVRLVLMTLAGVNKGEIVTNLPLSSSYAWTIPTTFSGQPLVSGEYTIRAIAYTTTGAEIGRMDSNIFSINTGTGMLSGAQMAAVLSALEALLKDALTKLGF